MLFPIRKSAHEMQMCGMVVFISQLDTGIKDGVSPVMEDTACYRQEKKGNKECTFFHGFLPPELYYVSQVKR